MAFCEDWVEHHPVPSPGLVLIGEQAAPDDRPQHLVLDRLVVAIDRVVEHVLHVVRVLEHELRAPRELEAGDVT